MKRISELVSIVIPAYNEEDCLERTLNETLSKAQTAFEAFEVIIVNDGSSDQTESIALGFTKAHSNITVLSKHNGGIGSALRYGFKHARGDYFIYTHADGQFDFDEAWQLVEALKNHDMSFGYKHNLINYTFFRKINSYGFRLALWLLFGLPFWDINFVHAYRREAYHQIVPLSDGVFYHAEIAIRAAWKHLRIKGLPVSVHERTGGEAKGASFRSIRRTLQDMLWFRLIYFFQKPE